MTDSPDVAVVHYPEGAGHATRMLAVADALETAGADVSFAGGGAGTEFVALNGYDAFEPTAVDYIDTYQGGSLRRVLTDSVPATTARVTELTGWLRDGNPDALVTDDMFAAMAAIRTGTPLYVVKHDMPSLYDSRVERAGASFHTDIQRAAAERFFYPAVWPASEADPDDVTRVPPIALTGGNTPDESAEIFVVPSHYSDLGRVADTLDALGYGVANVGGDDWEAVPSLLPHLRAADLVICSGYSTVMDAAVAGTPCIVSPATDEQRAVADRLADVDGFAVADTRFDIVTAVTSPPDPPSCANGADRIAAAVVDDLTAAGDDPAAEDADPTRRERVGAAAGRAVAGPIAGVQRAGSVVGTAGAGVAAGVRRGVGVARAGTRMAAARTRATVAACARYGAATATVLLATSVFLRGRVSRTTGPIEAAAALGRLTKRAGAATAGAGRALVDAADRACARIKSGVSGIR
jgi:hypothetical protein